MGVSYKFLFFGMFTFFIIIIIMRVEGGNRDGQFFVSLARL